MMNSQSLHNNKYYGMMNNISQQPKPHSMVLRQQQSLVNSVNKNPWYKFNTKNNEKDEGIQRIPGFPECMIESNYNKATLKQLKEYRTDLRALSISSGLMGMTDPIIFGKIGKIEKAIFVKESMGNK